MRTITLSILTALTLATGANASDYLSTLADKNKVNPKKEAGEPITTDEKMSVVLLSFQREEMERKKREKAKEKEAKRKAKEEKKNKRAKAKKTLDNKGAVKPFPSLEEQMRAFKQGRMITNGEDYLKQEMNPNKRAALQPKRSPYYGTLCKGDQCYLLGEHRLYKKGDLIDGRKITKITADYVKFEDKDKEWFTR